MSLKVIGSFIIIFIFSKYSYADNFPSLLTANATLAVVIDKEFLSNDYDKIKESIDKFLVYAKREILRHGGVNVKYYSWTTINVRRDFSAVLSIASCADTWKLHHSVADEHLLHMALTDPNCPRLPPNNAITVPLSLNGEEMAQVLLDLRMWGAFNWKSLNIVHDDSLHRDVATTIVTAFSADTPEDTFTASAVSIIKLSNLTNISNRRTEIKEQFRKVPTKFLGENFLVVINLDKLENIMITVKELGMVHPKSQWLYIVCDTNRTYDNISDYRSLLGEGDNVAFVYNITEKHARCVAGIECHVEEILRGFIIALDKTVQEEMEMSNKIPDEEWEAKRPTKPERSQSLLVSVNNYLKEHGECNNCTRWRFLAGDTWGKQFEQINKVMKSELLEVGYWRSYDGPTLFDKLFPHIAHGFRGRELPLVSFHNPPWQILKINESGSVVEYSGVVFNILDLIAKNLNFTFKIIFPTKNKLALDENEEYNPFAATNLNLGDIHTITNISDNIIEIVRKKSVLMAACGLTINEKRKSLIDFTIPISIQPYTFIVSRPKELSRALLFMSPFASNTWLCITCALVGMGPFLYLIHKFSPVYESKGLSKKGGLSSMHHCFWYMYGALMQQGGMHLPHADSGRLVIGTWWIVVLIIVTTYSGNLVAFLTFPKIEIPINTIHDIILHKESISWSIIKGTFIDEHFKTSNIEKIKNLQKRVILKESIDNITLSNVKQGKHVFIDWKINLMYIMKADYLKTNRCDLRLSTDEFLEEQIGLIVDKKNPYLPMLNDEIKHLHQVGLIDHWMKDYLPKKDRCSKFNYINEVKNHTVNMNDMQGSFFVLFLGFAFSVLVIIIENIWFKTKTPDEKKIIQPFVS